jgi:hypothetical protein
MCTHELTSTPDQRSVAKHYFHVDPFKSNSRAAFIRANVMGFIVMVACVIFGSDTGHVPPNVDSRP